MPSLKRTRTLLFTLLTVLIVSLLVTQPALAELRTFNDTGNLIVNNNTVNRDVTVSSFPSGAVISKVTIAVDFRKVNQSSFCNNYGFNDVRVGDIALTLIRNPGPSQTSVALVNLGTYTGSTFNSSRVTVTFDDSASTTVGGGLPTAGTFRPVSALSAFNGRTANATWRLAVRDNQNDSRGLCYYDFSLSITANNAPVANNDSYSTNQGTTLTVNSTTGVLANDTDANHDTLTAQIVSNVPAAAGSVTLNSNGSFVYTPAPSFTGSTSFTYRANDGTADSNTATVTITVNTANTPPVANADAYTTNEDTPLTVNAAAGVLANDTDADGNALTASIVSGPANGTLLPFGLDGSFTYIPNLDFFGTDTFTYRAYDGIAYSSNATVTITVNGINDPPVAVDNAYNTSEDTPLNVAAPGVLVNDTDADGDVLTATLESSPSDGLLTFRADGSFDYTPNPGFFGVDDFTYSVNDGEEDSNVATVTINVGEVNDSPVAQNDFYSTAEDTTLVVGASNGVLDNDTDEEDDPLAAVLVAGPGNGALSLSPDGSFTYTPNLDFNGVDTFTYMANDGASNSNVATVTIDIGAVDDVPGAVDDDYHTPQETPLTIDAPGLLGNDTDPNGDPLLAVLGDDPLHGGLILNPNGSFTYFPDDGFFGVDTFTYQATDGINYSEPATVTITVLQGGELYNPGGMIARDDILITGRDTPATTTAAALLSNDTVPADAWINGFTQAQNGTVDSIGDSIIYTPDEGFAGEDIFSYTVVDSLGGTARAYVRVTVWKPVPSCRDIGGEPNSVVYASVPNAAIPTGADVFCRVMVENGEFVRPPAEIGIPEVLGLNILQAVEVFGMHTDGGYVPMVSIDGPVTICLRGAGNTLFLSVTGQPRTPQWTESWRSGFLTCTTIPDAGTVILVN